MVKKEPLVTFKSKEEAIQVVEELAQLKRFPGWQRIVTYYDKKIVYLEHLLYEGEIKDIAELQLIRARRNMAIQFRNLPDLLVEFLEAAEGEKINLDPFEA